MIGNHAALEGHLFGINLNAGRLCSGGLALPRRKLVLLAAAEYYAPDPMETFGYVETSYNSAGDNVRSVAGVVIVSNPHQYQPLEQ